MSLTPRITDPFPVTIAELACEPDMFRTPVDQDVLSDCSYLLIAHRKQPYHLFHIPVQWWADEGMRMLRDYSNGSLSHETDPYDMIIAKDPTLALVLSDEDERNRAAERLAADEGWQDIWSERTSPDRKQTAILLAAFEIHNRQRIRLGAQFARHPESGLVVPHRPAERPVSEYHRWLRQRVIAWAAALSREDLDNPTLSGGYPVEVPTELPHLIQRHGHRLNQRERQVLEMRIDHMSFPVIAHELGISHAAARQIASRARKKLPRAT